MSYKADDRCRKCGPVGNGACRGYGRYGEPGHFDNYDNFHPDPEPEDDSYYREQEREKEEVRAELRQQKREAEAEEARERQSRSASQAAQPKQDSGMGGLAILLGALAGIALARESRKNRPQAVSYQPQPRPQLPKTGSSSAGDALGGVLVLLVIFAVGIVGVMALFGRVAWSRFFLALGLGFLAYVLICVVGALMERK